MNCWPASAQYITGQMVSLQLYLPSDMIKLDNYSLLMMLYWHNGAVMICLIKLFKAERHVSKLGCHWLM